MRWATRQASFVKNICRMTRRAHLVVLQPFDPSNGVPRLFPLLLGRLFVLDTSYDTVHLFQDEHRPVKLVAGRIGVLEMTNVTCQLLPD
jgi:hypothetical protein